MFPLPHYVSPYLFLYLFFTLPWCEDEGTVKEHSVNMSKSHCISVTLEPSPKKMCDVALAVL